MKCCLIFICCILTLWCTSAVAQTHSLFLGNRNRNDTVTLYEQLIVLKNPNPGPPPVHQHYSRYRRPAPVYQPHDSLRILNATITFPPHGTANNFVISGIQVIDNLTNYTGGTATILLGGINRNFATIFLKSQPGGDLNNRVTIFTNKADVDRSSKANAIRWHNMNHL